MTDKKTEAILFISKRLVIPMSYFTVSGEMVLLMPNSSVCSIFSPGTPEESLINWCASDIFTSGCFVDIGAHIGTYTIKLAQHPKCSRVVSFEPQNATFNCLCANIAINGLSDKVETYRTALGMAAGQSCLRIISQDGGGSSLCTDLPTHQSQYVIDNELVTVQKLDFYQLTGVSFIKIDVEGYELEVLQGAVETIQRCSPAILFEAWTHEWYIPKKNAIFVFLDSLNYKIASINGYPHMFLATKK